MGRILIVDDNKQNCDMLGDLLTAWGHEPHMAEEGVKALNTALRLEPDVVLLDVMLPGMNGFELCRKLKNNYSTRDIPVIMITALNEVEDRIRGFSAGADVFLSRPVIYQELKNRVDWAINCRRKLNSMEDQRNVVKSFMAAMKLKDEKLYVNACNVKNYCEKVAKLLQLSDEEQQRLLAAAYLHDIGKLTASSEEKHIEEGVNILAHLKAGEWLKIYVQYHHYRKLDKSIPASVSILASVNRFVELWEVLGSKEAGIEKLSRECKEGFWSREVLAAISQVLKDESFMNHIIYNSQSN